MANVLTDDWWKAHMPKGWSGTGISECLRTFVKKDSAVTASGISLSEVRGVDPSLLAVAKEAKAAAIDARTRLRNTLAAAHPPPSADEQADIDTLDRELTKAIDQYKNV